MTESRSYLCAAVRMARIKTLERSIERQPLQPVGISGELSRAFLEKEPFEKYRCRSCGKNISTLFGMDPLIQHWRIHPKP